MKITDIETFTVAPRWVFVKVSTDEDLVGWGEPTLEGRSHTMVAAVGELKHFLLGEDPLRIEHHFQRIHRGSFYRGGPILTSALSGVEHALWDIKGKALGVPVYQLLGGHCRDRIKVYSWVGGDTPDDPADHVRSRLEQGFRAVKMNGTGPTGYIGANKDIDRVVARMGRLRDTFGDSVDIAIDFHGRVHKGIAKALVKALEPFRPLFIEEPVLPDHNEALASLVQQTCIPIATGERMFTRWGFKQLIAQGVADIVQPDISHAGGILECKKIAAMAEAYDMGLAPHCPLGPVAAAACLNLAACTPNFAIQELSVNIHYNVGAELSDYAQNKDMFKVQDGHLPLPSLPGLGVEVDEERVRKAHAEFTDWKNPLLSLEDGSFAEW